MISMKTVKNKQTITQPTSHIQKEKIQEIKN